MAKKEKQNGSRNVSTASITPLKALLTHIIAGLGLAAAFYVAHNVYSITLVENPAQTLRLIWVVEAPVVILLYSLFRQNRNGRFSYLKAVVQGLLAVPAGAVVNALGAVALGAPFIYHLTRTLHWSMLMSLLTFVPAASVFGFSWSDWHRIFAHAKPSGVVDYMICLPAHGAVIGAWFGAWPMPLDWERPWQENVHGTYQSYTQEAKSGKNPTGFMGMGTMQDAQCLTGLGGSLRNRDICASGFENPLAHMNIIPIQSNTAGDYQINGQEVEAKAHGNWPQITKMSLNCSAYVSDSPRETGSINDTKFSAFHPGIIDGSFLTLAIGNNSESKTRTRFSSREIASKLEDSISLQGSISHVPQTIKNFSSLSNDSASNFPGFRSHHGGFPSPMCNLVGWMSSHSDDRAVECDTVGLSSNSFQSCGIPETFKQYDFFGGVSNERNLAWDSRNAYQSDLPPSFLFSGTNTCLSYHGFTELSELASESSKPMWTTTPPTTEQQLNCLARNDRDIFTSVASNCISLQGSSITQGYLGPISSAFEVNSAQPPGNSTFPQKIGPQIVEGCAINTATCGPFPGRLGLPLDDASAPQSAGGDVFPEVMLVETRSKVQQTQNFNPVQHAQNFLGPTSSLGHPQARLLPQFNVQNPFLPTGQVLPIAKVDKPPQVSNITGQLSLKRRANEVFPEPSWVHHKKLVNISTTHHSTVYRKKGNPATCPLPSPSSPSASHVKWQGFDEPFQPTGQQCLLCKNDLSFTPEGPIYQPTNPPAVAVLSCGHTFHDHCLQLITPEDQIKDPPCIPCAIGET